MRDDERTRRLFERARRALVTLLQRHETRMTHSAKLLAAVSYRGVLARGFALVRDDAGRALRSAAAVGSGARLTLEFADGQVNATSDADRTAATSSSPPGSSPKSQPRPASGRRATKPADQGNLF